MNIMRDELKFYLFGLLMVGMLLILNNFVNSSLEDNYINKLPSCENGWKKVCINTTKVLNFKWLEENCWKLDSKEVGSGLFYFHPDYGGFGCFICDSTVWESINNVSCLTKEEIDENIFTDRCLSYELRCEE